MTGRDQSMRALRVANETRFRQAELKRRVKDGSIDVMTAVADPAFQRRPLVDVLVLRPNWGPSHAASAISRLGFSPAWSAAR